VRGVSTHSGQSECPRFPSIGQRPLVAKGPPFPFRTTTWGEHTTDRDAFVALWRRRPLAKHFPQPCPRHACPAAFASRQDMTASVAWVFATFCSVDCCAVL
jgi:hypothetical protein